MRWSAKPVTTGQFRAAPPTTTGCSEAWLSYSAWNGETAGSNPAALTSGYGVMLAQRSPKPLASVRFGVPAPFPPSLVVERCALDA